MRVVIQRVIESNVAVAPCEGAERTEVIGKIGNGMMVLVGIEAADDDTDIAWISKKIVNLRIFDDANGVMNLSIKDAGADIVLPGMLDVAQFLRAYNATLVGID